MLEDPQEPPKAQFLAALIQGNASLSMHGATVQRSHRFPLRIFTQIENMARMGGVPVSLIINQVLECGLDAVLKELPEETANEVLLISTEQLNRPLISDSVEMLPRSKLAKQKIGKAK